MRTFMKNGVAMLALASLCSISGEGTEDAGAGGTGNLAADVAEDVAEAGAGVVSFIQQEGALVVSAFEQASAWVKSKLAPLSEDAQLLLTKAVQQGSASGGSLGEVVANTLDILYNDAHDLITGASAAVVAEVRAVDSAAITGVASLTSLVPSV